MNESPLQSFIQQATPTCSSASMSDSSDREASNIQAADKIKRDSGSQNSAEDRTLTVQPRSQTGRADSLSTLSHSPKSGQESSEYSPDSDPGDLIRPHGCVTSKQHYKVPIEATTKPSKGRRKKQSCDQPAEEPKNVQQILPREIYHDWRHKESELKQNEDLAQDTTPINRNTTVERNIQLLPLVTEQTGERVVKLLFSITIQDANHTKFRFETDIKVRLYDNEKLKVIDKRKERFKFADDTNTGNFEMKLVAYDKLRAVHTEKVQIHVSTDVYATDVSDDFVMFLSQQIHMASQGSAEETPDPGSMTEPPAERLPGSMTRPQAEKPAPGSAERPDPGSAERPAPGSAERPDPGSAERPDPGSITELPAQEVPGDTKPFICPNGSQPSSLDVCESEGPRPQAEAESPPEGPALNSEPEAITPMTHAATYPANSCLVGASNNPRPSPANTVLDGDTAMQNSDDTSNSNNSQQGLSGSINAKPVAETISRPKYTMNKDPEFTRTIPFSECCVLIPKESLSDRMYNTSCKTAKQAVEIEVLVDPDVTDTNPSHSRKGSVRFRIKVLEKDPTCEYKVSIRYMYLFAPEDEAILNDQTEVNAEKIPFHTNRVTFDISLGPGLPEAIEKCRSKTLQLQFKIILHLEQIYTLRDLYIPSIGASYGDIVLTNNRC